MINFSAVSWKEHVTFDEMMMMIIVYETNHAQLDFYCVTSTMESKFARKCWCILSYPGA